MLSWTEDSNEIQAALSYLAGICAPYVPENPGIITDVPKTIALVPIPPSTPTGSLATGVVVAASPPGSAPVTTISIVQTVTVPCTFPAGISAGQPIPSSSTISVLSTVVTVPQVQFATQNPTGGGATGTPNVVLAAGRPAAAPAVPTATSPGGPYGPTGGTTFATGVLLSGQTPPAITSPVAIFKGGACRGTVDQVGYMILGLMVLLAIGV